MLFSILPLKKPVKEYGEGKRSIGYKKHRKRARISFSAQPSQQIEDFNGTDTRLKSSCWPPVSFHGFFKGHNP